MQWRAAFSPHEQWAVTRQVQSEAEEPLQQVVGAGTVAGTSDIVAVVGFGRVVLLKFVELGEFGRGGLRNESGDG